MARDDAGESRQVQLPELPASAPETGARESRASPVSVVSGSAPKRSDDSEQMRRAVAQLERENRRLRKRCEEAELEIDHLERSLKNTENTLSFRLGYALIHSTKSLDALRSLPAALLELGKDSRRRQERSQVGMMLTALRASAISVARRSWPRSEGGEAADPGGSPRKPDQ